jgi:hypothetical protein
LRLIASKKEQKEEIARILIDQQVPLKKVRLLCNMSYSTVLGLAKENNVINQNSIQETL